MPVLVASPEKRAWPTVLKTNGADAEKQATPTHHRIKVASSRKHRTAAASPPAIDYYALNHQQAWN